MRALACHATTDGEEGLDAHGLAAGDVGGEVGAGARVAVAVAGEVELRRLSPPSPPKPNADDAAKARRRRRRPGLGLWFTGNTQGHYGTYVNTVGKNEYNHGLGVDHGMFPVSYDLQWHLYDLSNSNGIFLNL